ncbi:MAG: hypothetical protein WC796_02315 [Candidatus Pacearchaeota archaeon]|jgi:hypothetical protein
MTIKASKYHPVNTGPTQKSRKSVIISNLGKRVILTDNETGVHTGILTNTPGCPKDSYTIAYEHGLIPGHSTLKYANLSELLVGSSESKIRRGVRGSDFRRVVKGGDVYYKRANA